MNCTEIDLLRIPSNLLVIGDYAFAGCTRLEDLFIEGKTQHIGDYAFAGIYESSIYLTKYITFIGENAFAGALRLQKVYGPTDSYAREWSKAHGYRYQ